MKLHTIKAPAILDKKPIEIEISGYVAKLYVGAYQYKFLLQQTKTSEVFLVHYDSGQKLGSLTPVKLQFYQSYSRLKDREAAKLLIERLIERLGENVVQDRLNTAKVIN